MSDLPERSFTFCQILNSLEIDPAAKPAFDGMSGAYRYPDECPSPERLDASGEGSLMELIGVLRCLWGYRISLVVGNPRTSLEQTWNQTFQHAPNWPGFHVSRRSTEMMPIVEWCQYKAAELSAELDALDEQIRKQNTQK